MFLVPSSASGRGMIVKGAGGWYPSDKCFNIHGFGSINEAKWLIVAWKVDYNEMLPPMALDSKTSSEYCSTSIHLPQVEGLKPAKSQTSVWATKPSASKSL